MSAAGAFHDAHVAGSGRSEVLVHTALGGVFPLIHVVRTLSLPRLPAADAPWGAWGWVDLLARSILADSWSSIRDDHIWPLLESIDQRERSPLLGAPVEPTIARAAQSKLPPAEARRPLPSPAAAIVPEGGHRLAEQAVNVGIELLRTLVGKDVPMPVAALLHRPGVAVVTSDSMEIRFTQADAVVDVRTAGLHTDPGWIPVSRHAVRFHYPSTAANESVAIDHAL